MAITVINPADNRDKRYVEINKNFEELSDLSNQSSSQSSDISFAQVSLGQIGLEASIAYNLTLPENTTRLELAGNQYFTGDTYILCGGKTHIFPAAKALSVNTLGASFVNILYKGSSGLAVMATAFIPASVV